MNLAPETITYLNDRAGLYGGTAEDMLRITPSVLQTDSQVLTFWDEHDLSHIQSQAQAPGLADDWSNIIPEDPTLNQARGDQPMSLGEQINAQMDNWIDASFIVIQDPDPSDDLL